MTKHDEKMVAIQTAKKPVQAWLDHLDKLESAIEEHKAAGAAVIGSLLEVAQANGPFRFTQGRVNFRKEKNASTYSVHSDKPTTEM